MPATEIANKEHLARFLERERGVNAYPLGYLDSRYEDECTWFGEREEGEITTLALVYHGLSLPGLFTAGREDRVRGLLRDLGSRLPNRVVAHFPPGHRASIEGHLKATNPLRRMSRMGLTRREFVDPGPTDARVEVLTHRDTGAILQLYGFWPDNFFEPYQLETGLYFGVRDGDRLACIAGIHNVSDTFDVAAIGNLVSHPEFRGRGYASACSAALLRAVFERVSLVTLDVAEDNEPAVRTYKRLGFSPYGAFFEGEMRRR